MTGTDDTSLRELLGRVRLKPAERREFLRTDTKAILAKVRLLTEAAVYFSATAVADYGGQPGPTRAWSWSSKLSAPHSRPSRVKTRTQRHSTRRRCFYAG